MFRSQKGKGNPLVPDSGVAALQSRNECQYAIYLNQNHRGGRKGRGEGGTDANANGAGNEDVELVALAQQCMDLISPIVSDYIWHVDAFHLVLEAASSGSSKSKPNSKSMLRSRLKGHMIFGESVDDEWFVVYLLTYLTKAIPGICATYVCGWCESPLTFRRSITDNDGEFLLIETANCLPDWLAPETSENRVFISGGDLHIVPLPQTPAELAILPPKPTLEQSLALISSHPRITRASRGVNAVLQERLSAYPSKAAQVHRTRCRVPVSVACCLRTNPGLVAPAVHALVDANQAQNAMGGGLGVSASARELMWFGCSGREGFVTVLVAFSRVVYAMLYAQSLGNRGAASVVVDAPSVFGPCPHPRSPGHQEWMDGMKLTLGMELMMLKSGLSLDLLGDAGKGKAASFSSSASASVSASASSVKWDAFLDSLVSHGYFGDNIEGSSKYKELMAEARLSFQSIVGAAQERDRSQNGQGQVHWGNVVKGRVFAPTSTSTSTSISGSDIGRGSWNPVPGGATPALAAAECLKDTARIHAMAASIGTDSVQLSDSLEWMEAAPSYLEDYLAQQSEQLEEHPLGVQDLVDGRYSDAESESDGEGEEQAKVKPGQGLGASSGLDSAVKRINDVVASVSSFLEHESGLDGAEFPQRSELEQGRQAPMDDVDVDVASEAGSDVSVEVNEDQVMALVKAVLDQSKAMTTIGGEAPRVQPDPTPQPKPREVDVVVEQEEEEEEDAAIADAFDAELASTAMAQTFETRDGVVDPNHTLVANVLRGLEAQRGDAGPLTGILGSLGVNIPPPRPE